MYKVYLDDERKAPQGWIQTKTSYETIKLLQERKVSELSLDHDLGDILKDACGTGYDVLLYIEQQVAYCNMVPPRIIIHTANVSARVRMEQAVESIYRMYEAKTIGHENESNEIVSN